MARKTQLTKITASEADDILDSLTQQVKRIVGTAFGSVNITQIPAKLSHSGKTLGFTLTLTRELSPSVESALNALVINFRAKLESMSIQMNKLSSSSFQFILEELDQDFELVLAMTENLKNQMQLNTKYIEELSATKLQRIKNVKVFEQLVLKATSDQKMLFQYLRSIK